MNCNQCSKALERPMCCARCKVVAYCDRECQMLHWKVHKHECKQKIAKSFTEMQDADLVDAQARFKLVVAKYKLQEDADMLADLICGSVMSTAELCAKVGKGMTEKDAQDFLRWISIGIEFKEKCMDPHTRV